MKPLIFIFFLVLNLSILEAFWFAWFAFNPKTEVYTHP